MCAKKQKCQQGIILGEKKKIRQDYNVKIKVDGSCAHPDM